MFNDLQERNFCEGNKEISYFTMLGHQTDEGALETGLSDLESVMNSIERDQIESLPI